MLISSLAVLFIMAMNFNKESLPAVIMIPLMVISSLIGMITYAALVYWVVYYWSQYTVGDKILRTIKASILRGGAK